VIVVLDIVEKRYYGEGSVTDLMNSHFSLLLLLFLLAKQARAKAREFRKARDSTRKARDSTRKARDSTRKARDSTRRAKARVKEIGDITIPKERAKVRRRSEIENENLFQSRDSLIFYLSYKACRP